VKPAPGLVVAAAASSAGKTTVTLLLAAWARRQGLDLRGFKVGPDFIDPQYLGAVSGNPVPSLDPWFLGPAALRAHYGRHAHGGDLALAEGVMGLYDGKRGAPFGRYSTAEVARTLGLPVLLVLNARKAGATLATQALGLRKADPRLRFAGVVLNQASGPKSVALIEPALKRLCGLRVLGWLPTLKELALPERHLGLTAPSEMADWQRSLEKALPLVEAGLQPAKIFAQARRPALLSAPATPVRVKAPLAGKAKVRIAVALDEAFHFYYPENLDLLRSFGAELAFFSPLRDPSLPQGSHGLLVGGGFPESFGAALAANKGLRRLVKAGIEAGLPVWAECGGLMWLAQSLAGLDGKAHAMVGALAARTRMTAQLQQFGYTKASWGAGGPWGLGPGAVKGHEFHHSRLEAAGALKPVLSLAQHGRAERKEGWGLTNGLATYFHAYGPSQPRLFRAFVDACRRKGNP
jgi:cobyrinic acid a,c-diamide synthase